MGDGWEGCCHHPPAFLLHCPISLGLFSPRRGTSCGKDSCGDRARVHQFGTSAWASCVKATEAKLVVVVKRWRYTPDSRYFPRKKCLRQVCSHVVWLVSVWLTRLKSKGTGAFKHPSSRDEYVSLRCYWSYLHLKGKLFTWHVIVTDISFAWTKISLIF